MKITYSRVGNAKLHYVFTYGNTAIIHNRIDLLADSIRRKFLLHGIEPLDGDYIRAKCKEARENGVALLDISENRGVGK